MMIKPIKLLSTGLIRTVGVIGSLFVKQGVDGKVHVALGPTALLVSCLVSVSCSVQQDEPYSVCIRGALQSFKELVDEN